MKVIIKKAVWDNLPNVKVPRLGVGYRLSSQMPDWIYETCVMYISENQLNYDSFHITQIYLKQIPLRVLSMLIESEIAMPISVAWLQSFR